MASARHGGQSRLDAPTVELALRFVQPQDAGAQCLLFRSPCDALVHSVVGADHQEAANLDVVVRWRKPQRMDHARERRLVAGREETPVVAWNRLALRDLFEAVAVAGFENGEKLAQHRPRDHVHHGPAG